MYRFFRILFIIIGIIGPINSYPTQEGFVKDILNNEQVAILYMSCANTNLLSRNYEICVEDYLRTYRTLGDSIEPGMQFLLDFGLVVAYDNLHLVSASNETLIRLQMQIQRDESFEEDNAGYPEIAPVIQYLNLLARRAPSPDVRANLLSMIQMIFPQSVFSSAVQEKIQVTPCKSFGKRLEKLGHNIARSCHKFLDILERCIDLFDRITGIVAEPESDPI